MLENEQVSGLKKNFKRGKLMQRLIFLFMILTLAACAPAATPQAPQSNAPVQAAVVTAKPVATQPATQETPTTNAATDTPAAAPTDAPAIVPTEALAAAPTKKPVKTELEATDPTTVNLAAGRPQLVEFFAFW